MVFSVYVSYCLKKIKSIPAIFSRHRLSILNSVISTSRVLLKPNVSCMIFIMMFFFSHIDIIIIVF